MATEIWVNIGSGNGLMPDNTKPLPEPMLTDHQWSSVTFIIGQFHKRCLNYQSLKCLKFHSNFPGSNELKAFTNNAAAMLTWCLLSWVTWRLSQNHVTLPGWPATVTSKRASWPGLTCCPEIGLLKLGGAPRSTCVSAPDNAAMTIANHYDNDLDGLACHCSNSSALAMELPPSCAKPSSQLLSFWVILANTKIHLFFLWSCKTETVQVVEILPCGRQGLLYPAWSIPKFLSRLHKVNTIEQVKG